MSFSSKVVLVTGSSSGIGAAIAILFAKEGADVAIVGRNETKLNNVANEIEKYGNKVLVIKADVSKDNDIEMIVKKTVEELGKLDVLVNNAAAGTTVGSILDGKLIDEFDNIMTTNLRGPVALTALAAPHLIETRGNIINISSVLAKMVPKLPHNVSYAVSKASLDHFTRCAALELASQGVRVNSVKPGPVNTDFLLNAGRNRAEQDALWEIYREGTALKRLSEAEEVADLVFFLASDQAKSITGSSFLIDNGICLKS